MAEPQPDELTVSGGAGGVTARLEDLHAGARLLREGGSELAGLARELLGVLAHPALQSGTRSPLTLSAAAADLLAAVTGPHGAAVAGTRLAALGVRLDAAARGYQLADRAAATAGHEVDLFMGRISGAALAGAAQVLPGATLAALGLGALAGLGHGPASGGQACRTTGSDQSRGAGPSAGGAGGTGGTGLLAFAGRWLGGQLAANGDAVEHVIDAMPGVIQGATTLLPGAGVGLGLAAGAGWPPRTVQQAVTMLGAMPPLREPTAVQIEAGRPEPSRPPRDLADLASRVDGSYPERGARPGTVRVDRVTGPGGQQSWVVQIPGTQSWGRAGADPFDITGDLHELARQDTAARRTVVGALQSAGVRPGEPILMAGHSEGGMVAAGLASDPSFRSQYRVTHVVTMGAPIGSYPIPDGVQVLAVEHSDDLVPRLDGTANPDRPGWVTVSRQATPAGTGIDVEQTHAASTYQDTLALVDHSTDPTLAAWRAGLGEFLDRPGAAAVSVNVVGTRLLPAGSACTAPG